jgi:hypothetical protein
MKGRPTWILLDLVLFCALVLLSWQIVTPALERARRTNELHLLSVEAHALYDAFQSYYNLNRCYPDPVNAPRFEPATLEPLRRRGYYRGSIEKFLAGGQVDAYDSPSGQESNREYWLEMTFASDPSVRILIARSDDAPLGQGNWMDGVFIVRGGKSEPLK